MNTVHGNGGGHFGTYFGAFIVGAATGATIALLTTSRTGREMRARLKDAARSVGETTQRVGSKALEAGREMYEQAKETVGGQGDQGQTYRSSSSTSSTYGK